MKCLLHLKSSDKVYFNFKKYTSIAIVQFVQPLDIHSNSLKSINIFISFLLPPPFPFYRAGYNIHNNWEEYNFLSAKCEVSSCNLIFFLHEFRTFYSRCLCVGNDETLIFFYHRTCTNITTGVVAIPFSLVIICMNYLSVLLSWKIIRLFHPEPIYHPKN